jgi:hypothetical protein
MHSSGARGELIVDVEGSCTTTVGDTRGAIHPSSNPYVLPL